MLPPGSAGCASRPRPMRSSAIWAMSPPCPRPGRGALDWLAGSGWRSAHKPDFRTLRRRLLTPPPAAARVELWLAVVPRHSWLEPSGPGPCLPRSHHLVTEAPSGPPQPGEGLARARPLMQGQLHRAHLGPACQHHPIRLPQAGGQQADPIPALTAPAGLAGLALRQACAGIPSHPGRPVIWRQ